MAPFLRVKEGREVPILLWLGPGININFAASLFHEAFLSAIS